LDIDALELTTEELIDLLKMRMVDEESKELLFTILELSDSVKFAKYIPDTSDHQQSMEMAYKFIEVMRQAQ